MKNVKNTFFMFQIKVRCLYNLSVNMKYNRYLFLIIYFFLGLFDLSALAADKISVFVLNSPNIPVSSQILSGVKETAGELGLNLEVREELVNKDGDFFKKSESIDADFVLAIGEIAYQQVLAQRLAVPLILCGFFNPYDQSIPSEWAVRVTLDVPFAMRLKYLLQAVPAATKIGIIYDPVQNEKTVTDGLVAAKELNAALARFPVASAEEIRKLDLNGIDALLLIPDTLVCNPATIRSIVMTTIKQRIPVMGISRNFAEVGTLIAVASDYQGCGVEIAQVINGFLSGKKAADFPLIYSQRADYFINQAIAERQGVELTQDLVAAATEVFGK